MFGGTISSPHSAQGKHRTRAPQSSLVEQQYGEFLGRVSGHYRDSAMLQTQKLDPDFTGARSLYSGHEDGRIIRLGSPSGKGSF
jgi:hypothetical protein